MQTFEIFVEDDRYTAPTLHLVTVDDEEDALEFASKLIRESQHHLGAEVCQRGQRIFGMGSLGANRRPKS